MTHDHTLVGELITREYELVYPSKTAFGDALKVDRSTVYRLLVGDPSIKSSTLRRTEHLLGLPRGFLDALRSHDATAIADSGARQDVVTWALGRITPDTPHGRNLLAQ